MCLASLVGLLRMFGNRLLVHQHEFKQLGMAEMTVKEDTRFCSQIFYRDITVSRADVSRETHRSK